MKSTRVAARCVVCGEEYRVKASRAAESRYCSVACHVAAQRAGGLPDKTCRQCDAIFHTKHHDSLYCSRACWEAHLRELREEKEAVYLSVPEGTQRCRRCEELKSLTEFSPNRQTRSGYYLTCKVCVTADLLAKKKAQTGQVDLPDGYRKCTKCEEVKELGSGFYRNKSYLGGYYWQCKPCVLDYQKRKIRANPRVAAERHQRQYLRHQLTAREYGRQSRQRRVQALRSWIIQYKETHPCERCSESHPACLDFHHRDPGEKQDDISALVGNGVRIDRLIAEVEKCSVLCANCHRKMHWSGTLDRVELSKQARRPRQEPLPM